MITLALRSVPDVPLEAETITPDALAGLDPARIARLPVAQGNRTAALGDFFTVAGATDDAIRVEGDLSRVKWLGRAMTRGRLEIAGDAGMHVGAEMRGGELIVRGRAGDWAGAEMRGGLLRIEGDAGDLLGAGYRGSPAGMRGGTILVRGRAGDEVGGGMRRGLIAIGGDTGDFTGAAMLAGTILVVGRLGARSGAGMKRGSIVTFEGAGRAAGAPEDRGPALLPTFRFDCAYVPPWVAVYLRALRALGFDVPGLEASGRAVGRYRRWSGDLLELGKGEILAWTSA